MTLTSRFVILLVCVSVSCFCFGVAYGQATFEPQVITEYQTQTVKEVVYELVEEVVIKEVPKPLRNYQSLDELEQWLEETPIQIQSSGGNLFDCDNCALGLQRKALKEGYLMSFEVIWADEYNTLFKNMKLSSGDPHAINSVIIGNGVYYIEPQTFEIVFVGFLD